MAERNRGVVYHGTRDVRVENLDFPELKHDGHDLPHAVIVKLVASNICGSDQHMVRGRTTAPKGLILGHEITGEIVEMGNDVEFFDEGDLVSVPFNVACGRCRACKEQDSHICLTVNDDRAGGAYGYVDMGGWDGGQAKYVMVPYADYNLLKFPNKAQAMEKILDLTMLSDILPTGYHGAVNAGVGPGSTVYVAGAGPVGLACAASCQLLGAAVVIVGDMVEDRLEQARSFGCEAINLAEHGNVGEQIEDILGEPVVDCAVDCVGFEARGQGDDADEEQPAVVLNTAMNVTRPGGDIGIPGLYVTEDPGAESEAAQHGNLNVRLGLGWAKAQALHTGQTPVLKYNRQLMMAILYDKINIADAVNAQVITLDEAPEGYSAFDDGAARKFVIDPNGEIAANGRSSEKHKELAAA